MISAIHVSNRHKNMLGFPNIEQATKAISNLAGAYIVDIHDDGTILWDDYPQSSGREIPLVTPPLDPKMFSR